MAFGKRNTSIAPQRVIPAETWKDPESAAFFAKVGAQPDDPENIRVTAADIQRMTEEGLRAIANRIQQLEEKARARGHTGLRFRPFWLIPDTCWNGTVGDFLLYTLRLNPYEEWNTLILPDDDATSRLLGLPRHPGKDIPEFARLGEELILDMRQKLLAAHAEARRSHEFGRVSDLHDETVAQVKKLALIFADRMAKGSQ